MPTVLRFEGLRVAIYPNDHRPAHVHVVGRGCEAVFNLNCPAGAVALRENYGSQEQNWGGSRGRLRWYWTNYVARGRRSMVSIDEFRRANRRGKELLAATPRALDAHYDRRNDRIVVRLSSKVDISFSPRDAQGLEHGKPAELAVIEVTPPGLGIHFPKLDADLYIPALLEGVMGSRRWMAARLGRAGGRATTPAKKAASRANGRLGGRPRKTARR
jgi:hypothetical protein